MNEKESVTSGRDLLSTTEGHTGASNPAWPRWTRERERGPRPAPLPSQGTKPCWLGGRGAHETPFEPRVNGGSVEAAGEHRRLLSGRAAGRLSGPGLASRAQAAVTFRSGATMGLEVPPIHWGEKINICMF